MHVCDILRDELHLPPAHTIPWWPELRALTTPWRHSVKTRVQLQRVDEWCVMTDACQLWQWLLLSGKSERNFVFWLRTTSHHDILSETSPLSPRSSHTLIFDNTVSHKSVRAVAELQSQPTLAVSACLITKNKYDWMMLCIRTDNTTCNVSDNREVAYSGDQFRRGLGCFDY